jgi:hypothetical protein
MWGEAPRQLASAPQIVRYGADLWTDTQHRYAETGKECIAEIIPKALLADSWGDSRIGAMLIQDGMEGSRHAISGPIARGLFG